jgi:hypothetical protein
LNNSAYRQCDNAIALTNKTFNVVRLPPLIFYAVFERHSRNTIQVKRIEGVKVE